MNIFEQIKESITTKQAAIHYGMNVNQNNMVCCCKTPKRMAKKRGVEKMLKKREMLE